MDSLLGYTRRIPFGEIMRIFIQTKLGSIMLPAILLALSLAIDTLAISTASFAEVMPRTEVLCYQNGKFDNVCTEEFLKSLRECSRIAAVRATPHFRDSFSEEVKRRNLDRDTLVGDQAVALISITPEAPQPLEEAVPQLPFPPSASGTVVTSNAAVLLPMQPSEKGIIGDESDGDRVSAPSHQFPVGGKGPIAYLISRSGSGMRLSETLEDPKRFLLYEAYRLCAPSGRTIIGTSPQYEVHFFPIITGESTPSEEEREILASIVNDFKMFVDTNPMFDYRQAPVAHHDIEFKNSLNAAYKLYALSFSFSGAPNARTSRISIKNIYTGESISSLDLPLLSMATDGIPMKISDRSRLNDWIKKFGIQIKGTTPG